MPVQISGTTVLDGSRNLLNVASIDTAILKLGGVTVTATAAELNFVDGVTSNIQTQLNGKQASDSELTGLAAVASTGYYARTGAGAVSARTFSGGGDITVTNGSGVSGNTVISLDVVAKIASTSANEVGSYAFCRWLPYTGSNSLSFGTVVPGSDIAPASVFFQLSYAGTIYNSTVRTGSWRCMGSVGGNGALAVTLFLRIA